MLCAHRKLSRIDNDFFWIFIVADGSRNLIVAKILRYLTRVFTMLSESVLPNSMVTGAV